MKCSSRCAFLQRRPKRLQIEPTSRWPLSRSAMPFPTALAFPRRGPHVGCAVIESIAGEAGGAERRLEAQPGRVDRALVRNGAGRHDQATSGHSLVGAPTCSAAAVCESGRRHYRRPAPVPVGSRISPEGKVASSRQVAGGVEVVADLEMKVAGSAKPAPVEAVHRFYD